MQQTKRMIAGALMVSVFALSGIFTNITFAASLTSISDNLDRLAENTNANHTIQFVTPTGLTAGQTITLAFTGFDSASVNAIVHTDVDLATAATCTGFSDRTLAASASGASWGVAASGGVITLTSGTDTITATHCVQIQIGTHATNQATGVNRIQNGTAATTHSVAIAGTFADSGSLAVDIIVNDQVVITATVDPSITFALSDNTIEFGTLNSAAARYADDVGGDAAEVQAHTLSAGTNATGGYVIYVSGPTLTSAGNTINAIGGSNTASAVGTEQFGARYTASGGTGTVSAPYAAAGFAYDGITTPDQIASATGSTATTTYSARYIANIASDTEAGNYSTTLTYTATASF